MPDRQLERIAEGGVVAILRGVDPDSVVDVASAVVAGGVTALEITADTPGVTGMIETVSESCDEVLVEAGRCSTARPRERSTSPARSSSSARR